MPVLSADQWRRISPYLDRAMEAGIEERETLLAALRAEDPGLAADLESLLQEGDTLSVEGFLEGPALLRPQPSLAGQVVGAYTLESQIGQGGMGSVWRARRNDGRFQGISAVKLLNPSLVGRQGEQRFKREGTILARLTHPHIAHLLDAGLSVTGQPYLVLEHVEGETIDRYCDERRLPVEDRVRLFLDVAAAVAHAHSNLIVHRDIKPSNVLVSRDGQVKLLDFGIAKLLEPEFGSADASTLTREGGHAMTPEFAAPEQLTGEAVTTATDVHALGLLLYVLLAGRHPIETSSRTPAALLRAILDADAQRPSDAVVSRANQPAEAAARIARERATTPERLRRTLQGDLDTIVAKALKKRPEDRYASVGALADDLRRALQHEPIGARPDSLRYRASRFAKRHTRGLAAAAVALAVVMGLVAFYTVRLARERDRARQQADKAAQMARVAQEHAERADAVRRFLVGVFERAHPDENKGQPLTAHQLLERGEEQVETALAANPALRADVTTLLGHLYVEISDFPRAEALLARALTDSADTRVPPDVKARVLVGMAELEDEKGDYDAALVHVKEGLALLEATGGGSPQEIAKAHVVQTHSLIGKGDFVGAETRLRQTLAEDGAKLGAVNDALGGQWLQLGEVLGNQGRYDESAKAFGEGLRIYQTLFGPDSHHVAHGLNELSNMLDDKGDLEGAETALRQALSIRLRTVGPLHHDTLAGRHNLLVVVEYRGHYAEALPDRLELMSLLRRAGQSHPLDMAAGYTALGIDYRELGRLPEAEAAFRQALSIIAGSQGPRSPRSANTLHHLGIAQALGGKYREAEATFRDALAIQRQKDPETAIVMAVRHADLGSVLRQQRRPADALAELQQAARVLDGSPSGTDRIRPVVLAQLSEAQLDAGDAPAAAASAESALGLARKALPAGHPSLGLPLVALARAERARDRPAQAQALLREALAVRGAVHPAGDVRVREVRAELARLDAAH